VRGEEGMRGEMCCERGKEMGGEAKRAEREEGEAKEGKKDRENSTGVFKQ